METICVVFVCNKAYYEKFLYTCKLLVTKGNYKGDICLIIGNDLKDDPILQNDFMKEYNVFIKYFPDIQFTDDFLKINNRLTFDGRHITKKFQWHKMHVFNSFFKKWNYIFYLDCGLTIFSDIAPILNEKKINTLFAHSDAYPTYEWQLKNQFDHTIIDIYMKLVNKYNLNIDYFQTCIMIYDTTIIEENTFDELMKLSFEFPICNTNEQGIMSLYFTNIKPYWKPLRIRNENIHYYDFFKRDSSYTYIIVNRI